jgi:hypothetical protein
VFRDETGLSTNPHLWSSIVAALDECEWFVLLASPDAATSPWVDREIEHWLAYSTAGSSKRPNKSAASRSPGRRPWR